MIRALLLVATLAAVLSPAAAAHGEGGALGFTSQVTDLRPATPGLELRVLEGDWLSANQILFTGFSSTALVDSGYATRAEATVARVCQALGGRPLDALYNTHLHSDHCGGNAALQRAWGCPIPVIHWISICFVSGS